MRSQACECKKLGERRHPKGNMLRLLYLSIDSCLGTEVPWTHLLLSLVSRVTQRSGMSREAISISQDQPVIDFPIPPLHCAGNTCPGQHLVFGVTS